MVHWLVLFGCTGEPASTAPTPAPAVSDRAGKTYRLTFDHLPITDELLTNTSPTAVKGALLGYDRVKLGFHTFYKRGDKGFGDITRHDGMKLDMECNNQDFNALFEARKKLWLMSHFECTPGEMYLTQVEADTNGLLTPLSHRRVDFSAHDGLWNPCAGMVSPWGTHLGSEEYEPDASITPSSLKENGWEYRSWTGMQQYLPADKPVNPYRYGWTPEVAVMSEGGDHLAVKHKSPGRFSHEIAYVLPDERTVYLTDDGGAGGFFMFVADKPGDLSAGNLYAARFLQSSDKAGGSGVLDWIPLGHSQDRHIDGMIAQGITFSNIFLKAEPKKGAPPESACEEGYRYVHSTKKECLRLQEPTKEFPNIQLAASRLETRRYAAFLGATMEFRKGEGITYDPDRKVLFVSFSKIDGRMKREDGGANDHIQLKENHCGAVWAGYTSEKSTDMGGHSIDSKLVVTKLRSLIAGAPIEADARGNTCLEDGLANPDNITFLPHYDVLMIGEDTSAHAVASLWAFETRRSSFRRVMVAPRYGEITGIYWSPNLGGHGYLTVAVQHPWKKESLDETVLPEGVTSDDQRSITGYIGPFPPLD